MSDQEYYEEDGAYDEPQSKLPGWLTETPYWAISAVLHLIVILVIGGIVTSLVRRIRQLLAVRSRL